MPEIQRVTDPAKIVTDPVLISALAKQDIDPSYVEFFQDYASRSLGKEHSPTGKFYRDLISGRHFAVFSGLPMVDADGIKIQAGWKVAGINYFAEKNNLFRAKVQGSDVELIVRNDQPDGRKANDRLAYNPQLFLNGIEQLPSSPTLLPVDPVNSSKCQCHPLQPAHYFENTLEWDFGIARRRLRIIEGAVLGSWVFTSNPNGEVRIKYNQTGDYRLKLGQFAINDDEEVVRPEDFDRLALKFGYPIIIEDSATFYDTASDGVVYNEDAVWATCRGAATGDGTLYLTSTYMVCDVYSVYGIFRPFLYYDTSALPDVITISDAILTLFGGVGDKKEPDGHPASDMYIVEGTQADPLVIAEYDSLGAVSGSATPYSYDDWIYSNVSPQANDKALNATGIGWISITGITKFALRLNGDFNNVAPTGDNFLGIHTQEKGTGYKPKLVVTYIPAYDEKGRTQVLLAAQGKVDLGTFSETRGQVVLAAQGLSEILNLPELGREQIILSVLGREDKATFSDTAKLQTILAIQDKIDLATFLDIHEQVIFVVQGSEDHANFIDVGRLQLVLAIQGKYEYLFALVTREQYLELLERVEELELAIVPKAHFRI